MKIHRSPIFPTLVVVLFAALFPATAQTPNSLPVVVDNRSGATYHHVTSPPDFWNYADPVAIAAAIEQARLYPVFVLPMGTGYYDFELKATITDWASGTMVYWYASAIDSQPSNPIWDATPKIYFTNPESGDPRVWRTSNPSLGILEQLSGNTNSKIGELIVIPSKITGSAAWMYKGNVSLVWSYARISSTGFEKDALNNTVWHPIIPTEWRSSPIVP